ncbi:hypothetical protein O181_020189 [Austropuccinia psidii MF-1]|uniref:Uncharacterized protein n=1 Tax=Austropuccinia psidii MF-1 TaxID=1389203 RepID=A0A9Q3GVG1_9BASI|nr:hypothetical protein [Austropuccinia psidii MF-1]
MVPERPSTSFGLLNSGLIYLQNTYMLRQGTRAKRGMGQKNAFGARVSIVGGKHGRTRMPCDQVSPHIAS